MSHFSFTNSLYDECNINKKQYESVAPFNWITDQLYENKNKCFVNASPFMHNQFRNIPANSIEIENDLRNANRQLSRCSETRFDPTKLNNCKSCDKCNEGLPCGCLHCKETKNQNKINENEACDKALIPQYTRINKPCNIFSGITINRFHPLCEDLQDVNKIQSNSYIGSNTRLNVKDAFKLQQSSKIKINSQLKDNIFNNAQSSLIDY
jgi:hypothetical protein